MKTLYIECNMGAAGGMLMSALSELLPDPDEFIETLNSAGIPNVRFERSKTVKCGIIGTHINVLVGGISERETMHHHGHHHEHHPEHQPEHHHQDHHAGYCRHNRRMSCHAQA